MSTTRTLAHRLYSGETSFDFIARRKLWYMISAGLLLMCLLAFLIRGLALGIEFSGGTDFQVPTTVQEGTVEQVRQELQAADVPDLEPQVFALGDNTLRVQTRALDTNETVEVRALIAELAGASPEDVTYSAIGPSWGQQVSQDALVALVVFIIGVMLLIWGWFRDWRMSLAAIIPLAHDLILTMGIYALVGFTVTPATLIGLLTILGYSLYDTVVVFDQIRRNTKNLSELDVPYGTEVNKAINQVLVRSLNTTVIGILPVTGLLVAGTMLGSGPLGDLGLALFVGMLTGAYSSIFLAAPLLVEFNKNNPAIKEHDEYVASGGKGPRPAKARKPMTDEEKAADELARAEAQVATIKQDPGPPGGAPRATTRAERKKRADRG